MEAQSSLPHLVVLPGLGEKVWDTVSGPSVPQACPARPEIKALCVC